MASHTQLVYLAEGGENETHSNTEHSKDVIEHHIENDIESIQDIFNEDKNCMHIIRYLSSIMEEDTSSTQIICPEPRRINLLEKNLHTLPEKELWYFVLRLIKMANVGLGDLTRKYIESRQIDQVSLERYSTFRNLLWSFVIGTGCQFSQTKTSGSKKRFNTLRPVLSPTEGTSRFFCLPMAQKCHLVHINFVGGKRKMIVDEVVDYGRFIKDSNALPNDLKDTYETFYVHAGQRLTLNWIEWLTTMSSLKKDSLFIHTLCMVTFYHLISFFIELGFERDGELQQLLQIPFHISLSDWTSIFSRFVFEVDENENTLQNKFSYFIECFKKWKKFVETKPNTSKCFTDWHDLILSCLAFVNHSNEMKKKKKHRIWTDAGNLFGNNERDNWKLRRGFPLPIDCSHIKFDDVKHDIFCWSSLESHFVAIAFMALGCIKSDNKLNIEELFQKEIDTMKSIYSNIDKQDLKEMHKEVYEMDPMKAANAMKVMKELHVDQDAIAKKMHLPPAYEEAESIISIKTIVGGHNSKSEDERQRTFENTLQIIKEMFDREECFENITSIAREHWRALNNKYHLPNSFYCDSAVAKTHDLDLVSSTIYPDDGPVNMLPQSVYGDGNCLFRSFSLLCFGSEDHHIEMRCRAVLEMLCNPEFYLSTNMLKNEKNKNATFGIISAICISDEMQHKEVRQGFADSIRQSTSIGNWNTVSFWHLTALGSVCKRRVRSIYPATHVNISYSSKIRCLLNRLILPREHKRNTSEDERNNLYIMWTNLHMTERRTVWKPNHFVPCLPDRLGEEMEQFDQCGLPKCMTEQMKSNEDACDVVELSSDEEDYYEDGQRMTETPCSDQEIYFGATLEQIETVDSYTENESNSPVDDNRDKESNNERLYIVEEEGDVGEKFDENKYGGSTQIAQLLQSNSEENEYELPDLIDEINQNEKTITYYNEDANKTITTPNVSMSVLQTCETKNKNLTTVSDANVHVMLTPSKIKKCLSDLEDQLKNTKEICEIDEKNETLISHSEWLRRKRIQERAEAEETCDKTVDPKESQEEFRSSQYKQPDSTFLNDENISQDKTLFENRQDHTFDYTPDSLTGDEMDDQSCSQSLLDQTIYLSPIPKRKFQDEESPERSKSLPRFMTSTPKKPHAPLSSEAYFRKQLFKKAKTDDEVSNKKKRTAKFVEDSTPCIETIEAMRQNNETLLHAIQEEKDKNLHLTNQLSLLQKDHGRLCKAKQEEFEENQTKQGEMKIMIEELMKQKQSVALDQKHLLAEMSRLGKQINEKESSESKKLSEMEKKFKELKDQREGEKTEWTKRLENEIEEKNQLLLKLEETIQQKNQMGQQAEDMITNIRQEYDIKLNENVDLIKSKKEEHRKYLEQLEELENEKKSFISQLAKCVDQSNQQTKLLEEKDNLIHHLKLNTSVENNQLIELMDTKHTYETTIQTLEMERHGLAQALQEKEFELQKKIKLAQDQISLSNEEFISEIAKIKKDFEIQLENERSTSRRNNESTKSRLETELQEMFDKFEDEKKSKCKLERDVSKIKRQLNENETHMKEKNQEVKKLKEEVRWLKVESCELEKAKDDICAAKSELTLIEKDKKVASELIILKDRRINELEKKISQLASDERDENSNIIDQLSKANIQKDRYLKELEKTKDDLKAIKEKTEESITCLRSESDKLKTKIKLQENNITQLRAQLKDATQGATDQKNLLQPLTEQNDTLKAEKDQLIQELDKKSQMMTKLEECVRQRPRRRIITKIGQTQTDLKKSNKDEEIGELKDHVNEEINNILEEFNKRLGKHYIKVTPSKFEKELGVISEMLHSHWNFFIRNIEDFRCKKDMDEKFGIYVKSVFNDIKSIVKSMQVREENISASDHLKIQLNDSSKQLEQKDNTLTLTKSLLNTSETEKVKLAKLIDEKDVRIQKLSRENQSLHNEMEHMKNEMHHTKDDMVEKDRELSNKLSSMKAEHDRLEWQLETVKKRMQGLEEKLIEKNNHISKLEWTANQKQKKFSLLKDQVTTLSKLGANDDGISKDLMSLTGTFVWMIKAFVNFCQIQA